MRQWISERLTPSLVVKILGVVGIVVPRAVAPFGPFFVCVLGTGFPCFALELAREATAALEAAEQAERARQRGAEQALQAALEVLAEGALGIL